MELIIKTAAMLEALRRIGRVTESEIRAAAPELAAQMEAYAKQNAPWTDRTGNARRSLKGFTGEDGGETAIGVCGGMPYSPELEVCRGGKYAILVPTVDRFVPSAVQLLRRAIAGQGGLRIE